MLSKSLQVKEINQLESLVRLPQPVNRLFYAENNPGDLLALLQKPRVAIVGNRKITPYGRAVTIQLAQELSRAGVVIISGLALGVDSVAHQACLDAGGNTIAVLPGGIDRIYPTQHRSLADSIVRYGGAIVTEYNSGQGSPQKYQFIARNRIIAALSQGVVITEAATKSGSLHTAHFALEQGIEVFAVPGNITSANSAGTNQLIKLGAHPVTTAQDILEVVNIDHAPTVLFQTQNTEEAAILKAIQVSDGRLSSILQQTGYSAAQFQQYITMLEIAGAVRQVGPNMWSPS